jgi:hypothetical protein
MAVIIAISDNQIVRAQYCGTPGQDGNIILTTYPNTYYPGTSDVNVGAVSFSLGAAVGVTPIETGDLLLIIQIQSGDINSSNTDQYGDGIPGLPGSGLLLNSMMHAGIYEYAVAASNVPLTGGTLLLNGGLTHPYYWSDFTATSGQRRFQVIRVPQYLKCTLGANISIPAWNGATGGVLVLDVYHTLNFAGFTINGRGIGFRGGGGRGLGGVGGLSNTDYRSLPTQNANGSKGEGVAGTPRFMNFNGILLNTGVVGYPNGSYARGAPGNAGGGGTDGNPNANNQNSGGGGGANGGDGGFGGNSWSSNLFVGGHPGKAFPVLNYTRLIFGGGGGAGTTNNSTGTPGSGFASSGAAGGGIVMIKADTVIGSGVINVDGANANNTVLNDGGGGGGAAGSVFFLSKTSLTNILILARGGHGGHANFGSPHGPGGGGGGGVIYTNQPIHPGSSVIQGTNGLTGNPLVNTYKATPGNPGIINMQVQMPDLFTVNNAIICKGDTVNLFTSNTAYLFDWAPVVSFNTTNGSSVTCSPQTTTTYTVTGINSSGCYQSQTTTVTVLPKPELVVDSVSICIGQVTELNVSGAVEYKWMPSSGLSATTGNAILAGPIHNTTYSVIGVAANGCSTEISTVVDVNPGATTEIQAELCENQFYQLPDGTHTNQSGIYLDTLTSIVSGCDSVIITNLSILELRYSNTNDTLCITELPYLWNNNLYDASGTYSVTLTSSLGCDSVATLNLIVNPITASSTSITICETELPYLWNNNLYGASGTYSVTLTSSLGCDSVAILNLLVNPITSSLTSITICETELPYLWNNNLYDASGTYSETLTSSLGCDSVATLNLLVNPITSSLTSITICETDLPFTWNNNLYETSGIYPVTLTSSVGCDSVATLNLIVNPITASTTSITICETELPYLWNNNLYETSGTYSVTLTSSLGCDSVATLNLIVNPITASSTSITICETELPFTWNNNLYDASGSYSVTLTSSLGCDSVATLNLHVNPSTNSTTSITICETELPYLWNNNLYLTSGSYSVTRTSSLGCDSVATLNLIVNPITSSSTSITICETELPFTWNNNLYLTSGSYSVTRTSSLGCDSVATLNLIVNPITASTTSITICETELPYLWNNNLYDTSGNYSVTRTSLLGCDSVATLNLLVNPITSSSTSITI